MTLVEKKSHNEKVPVISVIIPMYNVEKYILECLESIVNQDTDEIIEIIIIDDCSPDESLELVKKYISKKGHKKNRIFKVLLHSENSGQGEARNTGLRNATSDIVAFVDSDDTLPQDAFSILLKSWRSSDCDILDSRSAKINENSKPLKSSSSQYNHISPLLSQEEIWEIGKCWNPTPWGKLIKKDFLIRNRIFFEKNIFYEDLLWAVELALKAPRINVISDITYNYRARTGSTTKTYDHKHLRSFIKVIDTLYNIFLHNKNSWDDSKITYFRKIYEKYRLIAIDLSYPNIDKYSQKYLFDNIFKKNITNLSTIFFSRYFSFKEKFKLMPFYCGPLGHYFIIFKSKVSKLVLSK